MKDVARLTRRVAVAGTLASILTRQGISAQSTPIAQPSMPTPVNLGHGLEIRDYRLFPTTDILRFIVELHNSSDEIVDTPAVGVILPHLDPDRNFAWANPVSTVLHPGMSDCLIGVAPVDLATDNDWGQPEWMLCNEPTKSFVDKVSQREIEFSQTMEIVEPIFAFSHLEITNSGTERAWQLSLQGIVRDSTGRICGALLPSELDAIGPGETTHRQVYIHPDVPYIANPFALINTVYDIKVSYTLQPGLQRVQESCLPAVPWN